MYRKLLAILALSGLMVSVSLAETYAEKLTGIDPAKKTITFEVDGKARTFTVIDKLDVQMQVKSGKRLRVTPVKDGLKGVKNGNYAIVTTEKRDGEEVVTKIVIQITDNKAK